MGAGAAAVKALRRAMLASRLDKLHFILFEDSMGMGGLSWYCNIKADECHKRRLYGPLYIYLALMEIVQSLLYV